MNQLPKIPAAKLWKIETIAAAIACFSTLTVHVLNLGFDPNEYSIITSPYAWTLYCLALSGLLFLLTLGIQTKSRKLGLILSLLAALAGLSYYITALYGFFVLSFIFFIFFLQLWLSHILPTALLSYILVKSLYNFFWRS
ncbi:MAG: hypothetical protein KIT70_08710 [Anaerolineales bacterium]|nr:MAG: hypothetical protein KIT70_08710 [Anaerolineales bacterium]